MRNKSLGRSSHVGKLLNKLPLTRHYEKYVDPDELLEKSPKPIPKPKKVKRHPWRKPFKRGQPDDYGGNR